jgi:UDP-3-O-[3-hydroxymyristoyl] N-acetylglucosamine deacetylase
MMALSQFNSSYQTTFAGTVACAGVGLHTGKKVNMTMHPAEADTGIRFIRLDIEEEKSFVQGYYLNVSETTLGTTLKNEFGTTVSTVEHLTAALWGMGVDNVNIVLDGPEVPIMDGSSEPFVFLIECAGIKTLAAYRDTVEVMKAVTVREGSSIATIRPLDGFALDIEIDYNSAVIERARTTYDFREITFKQLLSRARTFGFERDVEKLQSMGLARGGSLSNAIVIGEDAILNAEGLRFDDEFIRHKALDCVGDFFLAGVRLRGLVTAYKPGHGINNKLLRALFDDRSAWRVVNTSTVTAPLRAPADNRAYVLTN